MIETLELNSIDSRKKKLTLKQKCFDNKIIEIGNLKLYAATRNILKNRGITSHRDIKNFLYPSLNNLYNPFLLKDMNIAVDRIIVAINRNERVFVVGDYDTDGVTATSLMLKFFREIGVEANFYIPTRDDGYGLSLDAIKKALSWNAGLVITVDNGITSFEEVEFANVVGIDVIITDHHEPPEEIPNAYAVVNPKRNDSEFPFKELSGAGVAFNLLMALRNRLESMNFFLHRFKPNLKRYLDLVALGTLADIVPLLDENRIYVKYGLSSDEYSCVGIESLKRIAGINGSLTARNISFAVAPRINAAGRLYDASIVVDMFMKETMDEAEKIAMKLNEINNERRKLQTQIVSEIEKKINHTDDSVIVASGRGWHRGVIGIAANTISYKYSKPAIIISEMDKVSIGSGRSLQQIDLFSAIKEIGDMLEKFGGHKMAVGITIKNSFIEGFKEKINRIIEDRYGKLSVIESYEVDCEVSLNIFNREFLEEISKLEPYGQSNKEPLFFVRHAIIKDKKMVLNKYPKFLICDNSYDVWMISFDRNMDLKVGYMYDIVFTAGINNGYMSFTVKDAFLSKIGGMK